MSNMRDACRKLCRQPACSALIFLLPIFCNGCNGRNGSSPAHGISFPAMGTFASITMAEADAPLLNKAEALAAAALKNTEQACSLFQAESDIARLNRTAGLEATAISPLTEKVLRIARRHGELSNGAFDITVGPLMRLWGFRGDKPAVEPEPALLQETLENVGWRNLELSNGTARLLRPGTCVDLGGIAKGFGVDMACDEMLKAGITNVLINLGGNIRVLGAPDAGRPWRAAVRNPFAPDQTLGAISLESGMAVATSGHYEQFVLIRGRRATHIMHPRTGRPVEGMASVTIVAKTAADADALSTAAFVLGLDAVPDLIIRSDAVGALVVPDRRPIELWITPCLTDLFTPRPELSNRIKKFAP